MFSLSPPLGPDDTVTNEGYKIMTVEEFWVVFCIGVLVGAVVFCIGALVGAGAMNMLNGDRDHGC